MKLSVEMTRGLLERIRYGDRSAESEFVARYQAGVRLILIKRTRNPDVANDLCQETFVVLLRKLRAGEVRNLGSIAVFIQQTAVNISIQYFRKEKRYFHSSDEIIEAQASLEDKKDERLDRESIGRMLKKLVEQLAVSRDREILRRYYLGEDDKDAICRDLQLSPEHFNRVLYRAKERMRALIDQQPGLKALLFGGLCDVDI